MELVEENREQKSIYREMALNMSLAYQFVTPLTSMVVTESVNAGEVDEPIEDREMLLGLGKVSGGKIDHGGSKQVTARTTVL